MVLNLNPLHGGSLNDEKSLITNSARTLRRQSLTGISTSGSERCCRSSLGGKPVDSTST